MKNINNKTKKELLLLIILTLLVTLPFINQSFHIDDEIVLSLADNIDRHSLFGVFNHEIEMLGFKSFYMKSTHGLLLPLYIKNINNIFLTEKEYIYHLFYLIFPLTASISIYYLGKRFTKQPFILTLLVIFSPVFMVMSHNLMHDLPTFAFASGAIASYIYGFDNRKKTPVVFSGLLASLAVLISYQTLCLIPLLLLYYYLNKNRAPEKKAWFYWPVFTPLVIFLIISFIEFLSYNTPQILMAFADGFHEVKTPILRNIFDNTLSYIIYLGSATIFPLALIIGFIKKKSGIYVLLLATAAVFFLPLGLSDLSLPNQILIIVFVFAGIVTLYYYNSYIVSEINRDKIFLLAWFWGIFSMHVFFLPFNAVRHLLLLLIPLLIVFINDVTGKFTPLTQRYFFTATIGLTFLTALFVSLADYEYAGIYKDFPSQAKKFEKNLSNKNIIYFTGEWGFRRYMEKAGFKYILSDDDRPEQGDIVIVPEVVCHVNTNTLPKMTLIETISQNTVIPLRTMNFKAHAGFYSNWERQLLLPYAFDNSEAESFYIYKVE